MNLKNLEVIFIDWGGTLVHPSAEVFGECAGKKIDQDPFRDVDDRVKLKMEEEEVPANLSSLEFYYQLLVEDAFPGSKPEQKRKALSKLLKQPLIEVWSAVDEKAEELLEFLSQTFPLAILANDTKALPGEIRERGLSPYFKEILYSDLLGAEKPDSKIFLAACEMMDTKPEKSLYIGDAPQSDIIEGANRAEIRGIVVNRFYPPARSALYHVCRNLAGVIEYFRNAKVSH